MASLPNLMKQMAPFADVFITAGESKKVLCAHSCILAAVNSVFEKMLFEEESDYTDGEQQDKKEESEGEPETESDDSDLDQLERINKRRARRSARRKRRMCTRRKSNLDRFDVNVVKPRKLLKTKLDFPNLDFNMMAEYLGFLYVGRMAASLELTEIVSGVEVAMRFKDRKFLQELFESKPKSQTHEDLLASIAAIEKERELNKTAERSEEFSKEEYDSVLIALWERDVHALVLLASDNKTILRTIPPELMRELVMRRTTTPLRMLLWVLDWAECRASDRGDSWSDDAPYKYGEQDLKHVLPFIKYYDATDSDMLVEMAETNLMHPELTIELFSMVAGIDSDSESESEEEPDEEVSNEEKKEYEPDEDTLVPYFGGKKQVEVRPYQSMSVLLKEIGRSLSGNKTGDLEIPRAGAGYDDSSEEESDSDSMGLGCLFG